jgi:hypothetical protein
MVDFENQPLVASGETEWIQNRRLRMDLIPVDFLRKIL